MAIIFFNRIRAGHKKLNNTMKYYINSTSTTKVILLSTINSITTDEMEIEVLDNEGNKLWLIRKPHKIRH